MPLLDLQKLFNELFPICRSITGLGYRQSLSILQRYIPLEVEEYPSGSQVCNWTVPPEWILHRATLKSPSGQVILDTDVNPMCLMNYSASFHGKLSLAELRPHLFTLPDHPEIHPYVCSYYQANWGFCLSQSELESLQDGIYEVEINTEHRADGAVLVGICDLPGKSDKIVQISSYLCHPCMLNNELSGPLAMVYLYYLLSALPEREYTYRFVINPETIGSICYLSRHAQELKERLEYGIVLTCLASPYKTGLSASSIAAIDPQSLFKQVQNKLQQDSKVQHEDLDKACQEQYFYALHKAISESISNNFLPLPLSFKLTGQSLKDELKELLHPSQNHEASAKYNLKQRYQPHAIELEEFQEDDSYPLDSNERADVLRIRKFFGNIHTFYEVFGSCFASKEQAEQCYVEPQAYTYAIDRLLTQWQAYSPYEVYLHQFMPNCGSDERQYCSALANLPVVSTFRTMYDSIVYPFYHTQEDNQSFFSLDSIVDSALKVFDVIQTYTFNKGSIKAQYTGEPQLGKYNMYPNLIYNRRNELPNQVQTSFRYNIMRLLYLADGSFKFLDLTVPLKCSLHELLHMVRLLISSHLLCFEQQPDQELRLRAVLIIKKIGFH